jgi:hypothetical protein
MLLVLLLAAVIVGAVVAVSWPSETPEQHVVFDTAMT